MDCLQSNSRVQRCGPGGQGRQDQAKLDELILKAQGLNPEELPEKVRNQAARDQLAKWVVQPEHGGSRAYYRASTDSIQMPDYKQFHTEAGYLSTLAHEMVHSTGHGSRLARGLGGNAFGSDAYAKEELIAELGATFSSATAWRSAPTLRTTRATCHLGSSVSNRA